MASAFQSLVSNVLNFFFPNRLKIKEKGTDPRLSTPSRDDQKVPMTAKTFNSSPADSVIGTPHRERLQEPQLQLQLHRVGGSYELVESAIPSLEHPGELLIQVQAIGLNPIDWKSA